VTSWSLPISMGVKVVEAREPLRGELTSVTSPSWPTARVEAASGGHLIPHAADSVFTAMNRMLASGVELYWLTAAHDGAKRGDIYVPPGEIADREFSALAEELHLPVSPTEEAPTGRHWKVAPARIGLYKPWVASMDEGWTRWLLERYEFPFVNLSNEEIRSGEFTEKIDVLLVPDVGKAILAQGKPDKDDRRSRFWSPLPPPYAGGLDETPDTGDETEESKSKKSKKKERDAEKDDPDKGGERIKKWVESGGTVVALDSSTEYFIELFELPVQNVLSDVSKERFDCPGSMLRVLVDTKNPLGYGMRSEEAAYFARSPALQTRVPDARFRRRVLARYPDDAADVLISGYLVGAELLKKRAAAVEFEVGRGRVVLIGFRAQHRAQPLRTFKLLFNTFYGLEETTLAVDAGAGRP